MDSSQQRIEDSAKSWTRITDGYQSGDWAIYDNGAGFGPSKGSKRWAVMYQGKWIANVDTLAEAKTYAKDPCSDSSLLNWGSHLLDRGSR